MPIYPQNTLNIIKTGGFNNFSVPSFKMADTRLVIHGTTSQKHDCSPFAHKPQHFDDDELVH